jgi:hypothetical protein
MFPKISFDYQLTKTQVIMWQKEVRIRRINIQTENKLLEQIEHYKYLGSIINQGGSCIIEIRSRITQNL